MLLRSFIFLSMVLATSACGKISINLSKKTFPVSVLNPIPFSAGSSMTGGGAAQVATALGNHATLSISPPLKTVQVTSELGIHAILNSISL